MTKTPPKPTSTSEPTQTPPPSLPRQIRAAWKKFQKKRRASDPDCEFPAAEKLAAQLDMMIDLLCKSE